MIENSFQEVKSEAGVSYLPHLFNYIIKKQNY